MTEAIAKLLTPNEKSSRVGRSKYYEGRWISVEELRKATGRGGPKETMGMLSRFKVVTPWRQFWADLLRSSVRINDVAYGKNEVSFEFIKSYGLTSLELRDELEIAVDGEE